MINGCRKVSQQSKEEEAGGSLLSSQCALLEIKKSAGPGSGEIYMQQRMPTTRLQPQKSVVCVERRGRAFTRLARRSGVHRRCRVTDAVSQKTCKD